MPRKTISVIAGVSDKIVKPGKRPNHQQVLKNDEVSWENTLASEVLLIFNPNDNDPHDVRKVFDTPITLVMAIGPNSSAGPFKVKLKPEKGFHKYKVYVVDDDEYAKAGSDAEFEVK